MEQEVGLYIQRRKYNANSPGHMGTNRSMEENISNVPQKVASLSNWTEQKKINANQTRPTSNRMKFSPLFTLLSSSEVPHVNCQSKTCFLLLDLPQRERKSFAKVLWSDQYIIPSIQIHTCTQPGKILSSADHDTLLIQFKDYYFIDFGVCELVSNQTFLIHKRIP